MAMLAGNADAGTGLAKALFDQLKTLPSAQASGTNSPMAKFSNALAAGIVPYITGHSVVPPGLLIGPGISGGAVTGTFTTITGLSAGDADSGTGMAKAIFDQLKTLPSAQASGTNSPMAQFANALAATATYVASNAFIPPGLLVAPPGGGPVTGTTTIINLVAGDADAGTGLAKALFDQLKTLPSAQSSGRGSPMAQFCNALGAIASYIMSSAVVPGTGFVAPSSSGPLTGAASVT